MRTTVTLDEDVARLVAEYRREHSVGLSGAVNALIRQNAVPRRRTPFKQRTSEGHARIDITNVGEVLAILDEEAQ